ncbi:hypothetical protein FIU87_05945 [Bacillus sp. THAF10]|uniref:DUF6376 family protein n=1 Tax=Bacillus sp. THAF10 TaxID=2587848 RepID=UPI001269598E|nr:DUF6376 family protein [Bacillus sp. THAF10]QFT88175.1 hypothetical protein FIU87_05945 [Bacillus sp. THAF10]
MKKMMITFAILVSFLLSGCSVLEEVNNSLEYANKATDHINMWQDFGQEAPQLIQEAATNQEAKEELETKLNSLSEEIEAFNKTEPPAVAESIHQQIVDKNEQLKNVIDSSMTNGEVAIEKLQDSEMMTLINDLSTMMNLIEELGQ